MEIIQAMEKIRSVFMKYAQKHGDPNTLSKEDIKEFFKTEFEFQDTEKTDKFLETLDEDKNGVVDFNEFLTFVAIMYQIITE